MFRFDIHWTIWKHSHIFQKSQMTSRTFSIEWNWLTASWCHFSFEARWKESVGWTLMKMVSTSLSCTLRCVLTQMVSKLACGPTANPWRNTSISYHVLRECHGCCLGHQVLSWSRCPILASGPEVPVVQKVVISKLYNSVQGLHPVSLPE